MCPRLQLFQRSWSPSIWKFPLNKPPGIMVPSTRTFILPGRPPDTQNLHIFLKPGVHMDTPSLLSTELPPLKPLPAILLDVPDPTSLLSLLFDQLPRYFMLQGMPQNPQTQMDMTDVEDVGETMTVETDGDMTNGDVTITAPPTESEEDTTSPPMNLLIHQTLMTMGPQTVPRKHLRLLMTTHPHMVATPESVSDRRTDVDIPVVPSNPVVPHDLRCQLLMVPGQSGLASCSNSGIQPGSTGGMTTGNSNG